MAGSQRAAAACSDGVRQVAIHGKTIMRRLVKDVDFPVSESCQGLRDSFNCVRFRKMFAVC